MKMIEKDGNYKEKAFKKNLCLRLYNMREYKKSRVKTIQKESSWESVLEKCVVSYSSRMSGSVPIIQDPESDDPTSSSMQREQRNYIQQQGQYGPNHGQLVPVTQRAVDIRALMTKSETLTRWYPMIVGRDGTGISVFGYLPSKNKQMITASIFHVHAGRFLVTTANDAYYLDGPIDRQSALQLG
ncbi:hypothetical protein WR25_09642 [Diploscapter pachys]|uniref:Uncharacterized protein n=1 Tax=Diploscapter pachys TaxID=2018661 RepID=A0A2A2J5D6_9BILA|nr:hypothetical protein WR25_09642 [Diploscapter pachys]